MEQRHFFYLSTMDSTAFHGINAGCIDTGMAQDIRQPDDISFNAVVDPREQMS